ncbi:MAG: VWA domain-containing protein [Pseudomonadota bacterium]
MANKTTDFTNNGTFDGLDAQIDLTLPNVADDDLTADIQLSQSGVSPDVNVVFAIDRSGSTSDSTGIDYNGDGSNDTFLEAQIFALEAQLETLENAGFDPADVTITIVDYAGSANSITRTLADMDELITYANGLSSSGTTNYAAALSEAEDALDAIPGAADDTNIVYFYSDGRPFPADQDFETPLDSLNDAYDPAVFGVAFGPNADDNALGIIDDSGDAQVVLNEQDLEDLVSTPPPLPDVENFQIFVDGTLVDTLEPGDAEVVSNPTGFTITGLDVSGYPVVDNTEQTINVEVVVNFTNGESLSTSGPVKILDGVVEGTAGDDLIDTDYEDDPEGDKVDNHDNVDDTAPMEDCDDDVIAAGAGDDTIDSGLGNDTVDGGAGDDLFVIGQEGNGIDNDVLIGGEADEDDGGDTVDTTDIDDDLTVTFTGDEEGTITDGTDTTRFEEMENIQLGGGDDSVTGGDGNENVDGGAGEDTLDGGDGADTLSGGDGSDEIDGGAGDDVLDGGEGDDTIDGGDGADTVTDLEGDNVIDTSGTNALSASSPGARSSGTGGRPA